MQLDSFISKGIDCNGYSVPIQSAPCAPAFAQPAGHNFSPVYPLRRVCEFVAELHRETNRINAEKRARPTSPTPILAPQPETFLHISV
jgi:hypothetical protein